MGTNDIAGNRGPDRLGDKAATGTEIGGRAWSGGHADDAWLICVGVWIVVVSARMLTPVRRR